MLPGSFLVSFLVSFLAVRPGTTGAGCAGQERARPVSSRLTIVAAPSRAAWAAKVADLVEGVDPAAQVHPEPDQDDHHPGGGHDPHPDRPAFPVPTFPVPLGSFLGSFLVSFLAVRPGTTGGGCAGHERAR